MSGGRICPSCGHKENTFTYFCTECGAKTIEVEEQELIVENHGIKESEVQIQDISTSNDLQISQSASESKNVFVKSKTPFDSKKRILEIIAVLGFNVVVLSIIVFSGLKKTDDQDIAETVEDRTEVTEKNEKMQDEIEHAAHTDDGNTTKAEKVEPTIEQVEESSLFLSQYNDIPNWYEVGKAVVNNNQICFSRDDGLEMDPETLSTFIRVYTFDDGGNLQDIVEYIFLDDEEKALEYCEELNTYVDGKNNFGMEEGQTEYHYFDNVLVEQFTKSYIAMNEEQTLDAVRNMYAGYGWGIVTLGTSADQDSDVEEAITRIREWYYSAQNGAASMDVTESDGKSIYWSNGVIKKIVVLKGTSGVNYSREYFFNDDKLYFVFVYQGEEEHRLYFWNNELIRYIDENSNIFDSNAADEYTDYAEMFQNEAYELYKTMQ